MSKSTYPVGQHLFVGITGTALTTATRQLLTTVRPGGVILFARNILNAAQLRDFTRELHELVPLIGVDQENNRVNRLRDVIGELPSLAEVKSSAQQFGRRIGRDLREQGIDLDFAPVLDLNTGDFDNALRDRCWGTTAAEVVAGAGAFLAGLQAEGVIGCAKHFPGLGSARLDSHEQLPTITRSRELLAEDIEPYRQLRDRLPAIMVSHGHYVAFDGATPKPASLSSAIITGLLRRELGYTGVVVTDDMEMGAITQFEESVVSAMAAGADMILVCHTPEKILAAQAALAKVGSDRLRESRQRIGRLNPCL